MHDHRQVDTLLPQPQGELADAADLTELAECQRQRLANPQIRVLFQAVAIGDVLVDNFRPSVPARLGIDYPRLKAINPRLVYCGVRS
jgi:hypothetical protein